MAGLKKPEPENPVRTQHPEERRADKNLEGVETLGEAGADRSLQLLLFSQKSYFEK